MNVFVARQPIFTRNLRVYAYELLFRSSLDNVFGHHEGSQASSKVITDSFLAIGLDVLTGRRKAFINFTRDLLIQEYAFLFPRKQMVVEILEEVHPDAEVVAACRKLKRAGYLLALDDFIDQAAYAPFFEVADILKVDFLATDAAARRKMVERLAGRDIKLLAEKVETREAFDEAVAQGYTYFQGYFFSKPVVLQGREVPGFKFNYIKLLQAVNQPDLDYTEMEGIIQRDVSLAYKFLRYINSAAFGWSRTIKSIREALTLLGQNEVRRWVSLIALSGMGQDKPQELTMESIIRAKFCESLAGAAGLEERKFDLFLMGMFSMLDAILDRPLADALAPIPLADDVKSALLSGGGRFRQLLELVLAYERAHWMGLSDCASGLGVDETRVPEIYLRAVEWAEQVFQVSGPEKESPGKAAPWRGPTEI